MNVSQVNRAPSSMIQQAAAPQPTTVPQTVHELNHQVETSKPPVGPPRDGFVSGAAAQQQAGSGRVQPRKQSREELALKTKHRQQAREQGALPEQRSRTEQSRHKPPGIGGMPGTDPAATPTPASPAF